MADGRSIADQSESDGFIACRSGNSIFQLGDEIIDIAGIDPILNRERRILFIKRKLV
jgi:hypothetical protein